MSEKKMKKRIDRLTESVRVMAGIIQHLVPHNSGHRVVLEDMQRDCTKSKKKKAPEVGAMVDVQA